MNAEPWSKFDFGTRHSLLKRLDVGIMHSGQSNREAHGSVKCSNEMVSSRLRSQISFGDNIQ